MKRLLKSGKWIAVYLAVFLAAAAIIPTFAFAQTQPEEDVAADDKITALFSQLDFSSCRLLAGCENAENLFACDPHLIARYNQICLLQYDSPEDAAQAYAALADQVDFIEVDTGISIAEGEAAEAVLTDTYMTEEENPFAEMEEEAVTGTFDIALIDTGANGAEKQVSLIGEDPSDDNGHGSQMLAYIKEQNPQASVLSIKALGRDGTGDISAVYAAVQYAIRQKVSIINLSVSALAAKDSQILEEAVKEAEEQGIFVVGAAGNNGRDAQFYVPGGIAQALIVGACREDGTHLPSSNYGDTVDYYVTADSTSEACAKFSGWLSANGYEALPEWLNRGFVFDPDGTLLQEETENQKGPEDTDVPEENGEEKPEKEPVREMPEKTLFQAADSLSISRSGYSFNVVEYGTSKVFAWEQYSIGGTTAFCTEWGCDPIAGNYYTKGQTYTTAKAVNAAKVKYLMDTAGYSTYGLNAKERDWIVQRYIWESNLLGLNWTAANGHGWSLRGSSHTDANNKYAAIITAATSLTYVSGSVTHYRASGSYQDMVTVAYQAYGNLALTKGTDRGTESLAYAVYTIYAADKSTVVGWFIINTDGTGQVAVRIAAQDAASFEDHTADYTTVKNRGKAGRKVVVKKGKTISRSATNGSGKLITQTLSANTTYSFGRLNPKATYWYGKTSATSIKVPAGSYYYKEGLEPMNQLYELDTDLKGPFTVSAGAGVTKTFEPEDERKTGSLEVRKTLGTGSLKISKKVQGEDADPAKEFSFQIKLTSANGTALSGPYSFTGEGGKKDGSLSFSKGEGTLTLAGGQSATITGLPEGTKYTVTETADPEYSVSQNPQNGQLAGNQEFTFTINIKSGTANVNALKMPYTGSKKGTLTTNKSGNATIKLKGGESITLTDIPTGYKYTVSETAASGFTTTKKGDSGTIGSTASVSNFTNTPAAKNVAFLNTKTSEPVGGFRISKTVEAPENCLLLTKKVEEGGAGKEEEEFAFRLQADCESLYYTKYEADGKIAEGFEHKNLLSDGSGLLLLKSDQFAKIYMPAGTAYTIEEDESRFLRPYQTFVETNDGNDRQESRVVNGTFDEQNRSKEFVFTVAFTDSDKHPVQERAFCGMKTTAHDTVEVPVKTDENGQFEIRLKDGEEILFGNLPEGWHYSVREEQAEGFAQSSVNAEDVIAANETCETFFTNVADAQEHFVTFINRPYYESPKLKIRKTDAESGALVAGAVFSVTDTADPSKQILYTTEEEIPLLEGDFLEAGHTYELREIQFPDGYVLNEDVVTFYVDEEGTLHFETYSDQTGTHPVAAVTHQLETAGADGLTDTVDYVVKEKGQERADYEITYEKLFVDAAGMAAEEGDLCYVFHMQNSPNRLTLLKTDAAGRFLPGVEFEIRAESLPEDDRSTVIAYRDADALQPFFNGDHIQTDASGEACLYRLNTGIVQTEQGQNNRTEETYLITETKTLAGKQLLADILAVTVSEKGRIFGTMQKTIGRHLYDYTGTENRKDGDVHYTLQVANAEPITLKTGGEGGGLLYLTGSLMAAATAAILLTFRRKNLKDTAG